MRTGVMRFLDADSFDIRLELLRTEGIVRAEACDFYCRLSLRESVRNSHTFAEQKATIVDERGPSLVVFLANLSEDLAQPQQH
jgi:hypothetical protein